MDWYHIFLYVLAGFGFWVAACLLVCVFNKRNRSTAASASIFPILIFFILIAMMVSHNDANLRARRRKQRLALFAAVCVLSALIYWHAAIWGALVRAFGAG